MKRFLAMSFSLLAILGSSAACVIDGGDRPVPDLTYPTTFDAAQEVGSAFCAKLVDCGDVATFDFDECVDVFVSAVCDERQCRATPRSPDAVINNCVAAIEVDPCGIDGLPLVCEGIL